MLPAVGGYQNLGVLVDLNDRSRWDQTIGPGRLTLDPDCHENRAVESATP
jgi:hypothetical protein